MDNITTINLAACPLQYLSIGYVGETGARPVAFDFYAWATEYGSGVLQLLLQRPGDADPYPVVLDIDGTTATWTPDATDTAAQGQGQAQLVYTVGGVVVKNAIFRVLIAPSLGVAGNPPEPYEDWLERLLTIAAEAQQSAIDAAGSAEAAGTSAGAAAGSAGAAAQSALDAEAAKTGAETAAATAGQSAALARAKAAEAAEAAQIAGREADYAQQQNIAAGYSAESAHDDAERAAQSAEDAQAAASAAQTAATAAGASAADAAAAVTEVETKGAEQIAAINQAGTTQIAAVDAAGAAQVQAIEDKGEEVIASIPSDYTELMDEVSDLKSSIGQLAGLKTTAKTNLVAAINELFDALFPEVVLLSISADFQQGSAVISTTDTLDALKPMLTVTAAWDDGNTSVVPSTDYTLSGSLTAGVSTITVSYREKSASFTVNVTDASTVVDVCLFGGQSNMDGRGNAEEAPVVAPGTAYKWNSSSNAVVDFAAENSLIPAFVKTYYEETGVPIVEVKEAIGGTRIAQYISDYLQIGLTQLQNCISWLGQNNKTVRRVFMLWNQGESDVDGDGNTGTTAYENYFDQLRTAALAAGIEQIFIINIGQASSGNFDFAPIRTALQDVCNGTNTFMVCDKFFNATQYMKDQWHYNQVVYNVVGTNSAQSVATYFETGSIPTLIDFDASDVYGVPEVYGTLDDWNYTLVYTKVSLDSYKGSGGAVRVYHLYKLGDKYYEARLLRNPGGTSTVGAFYQNQNITSLVIDDGVKYMNGTQDTDVVQSAHWVFRAMAECVSIVGIPDSKSQENAFRQSSKLKTVSPFSSISKGSLAYAFQQTAIEEFGDFTGITSAANSFSNCLSLRSVGSISGTYTSLLNAFSGCSSLESIGTLDSTALTSMNSAFNGCSKLSGIVKIMSPNVTSMAYAFYNCDLTKIEIQVPANSTTYDTLIAAYPTANVTTF